MVPGPAAPSFVRAMTAVAEMQSLGGKREMPRDLEIEDAASSLSRHERQRDALGQHALLRDLDLQLAAAPG